MPEPIIQCQSLTRTFRTRRGIVEAVRGVDFSVEAGTLVGFLGPNGAGKTTTLRMLTTLLDPTSGSATVAGCDLRSDPVGVRKKIGYVAQGGGTDPNSTVMEEMLIQARLYRIEISEAKSRCKQLISQLDLGELENRMVKTLSGGQRRRLDIALGLVHRPPLIFLDEPTTGLDIHSRSNLWSHIRNLRRDFGVTVFLTTHYLEEADALCDRVMIIDHGKIVADGSPAELKQRVSGDVISIEIKGELKAAQTAIAAQPGVRKTDLAGSTLRATVDQGDQMLLPMIRTLDSAGVELTSIALARPTLDDVFLTLTGRSLREESEAG